MTGIPAAQLSTFRFQVRGMDCASCASKIETALRGMPHVSTVQVSTQSNTATLRAGAAVNAADVIKRIQAVGYDASLLDNSIEPPAPDYLHNGARKDDPPGRWWQNQRALVTIACGMSLALAYFIGKLFPATEQWAFLAALAVGLIPVARRALAAARFGTPFSIEMLMTIAAIGAVLIGAAEEAAMVVFLFLVGELLEGVAAGRARKSIQDLTKLVPKTALLDEGDGRTREVPAEELQVDALIVVRPGDRIPADGVIESGEGAVDEAPVTGESTLKRKSPGAQVFAGTINSDGVLRIRVTATAQDNTIARVVRLVEEAQESKAPTERFIDRFSKYYTPGVLVLGGLVAAIPPLLLGQPWSEWIYKSLAILLIGCPCALVISTPAAIAAGLSAGARRGLLLKGGAVLESLGRISYVALDKTGTLTEGRPKVTDLIAVDRKPEDVLALAAALEHGSNHPLARAIVNKAREQVVTNLVAENGAAAAGKGVTGRVQGHDLFLGSPGAARERSDLSGDQLRLIEDFNSAGKSVSVLVADGKIAGFIAMRDEPRPDAKAGIAALSAAGIGSIMVTGDNARTADAIAVTLGLKARAELLPEHKQVIVRELQSSGFRVAKVGDGINDAPALAAADVGIAMGGGTDVALETADAAILHGRVVDVWQMIRLSRGVMRNIYQNISIALGLKAVFLVTTLIGVTGLWPAILADTGATVLVTANALRLLRFFSDDEPHSKLEGLA